MTVIFVDLYSYSPAPFVENPVSAARSLAYLAGFLGQECTYSDPAHRRAWALGKAWQLDRAEALARRAAKVTTAQMEARAA